HSVLFVPRPPSPPLFPYTTLFRSMQDFLSNMFWLAVIGLGLNEAAYMAEIVRAGIQAVPEGQSEASKALGMTWWQNMRRTVLPQDRKSTRLNSSHVSISYAVFCLK